MNRCLVVLTTAYCLSSVFGVACVREDQQRTGAASRVVQIGNLTWQDVEALDRDKTIFLVTVGMLEEHGPHLPIASDTLGVEYEVARVAQRLMQALSGWHVVVMPTIHYGSAGANQVGNIPVHPGTYAIRQSTLRSLIADLGAQIAQNRFKWVFVMNGHGAPTHHVAVNEACDFVSETFKVTMLNVSGLFTADAAIQSKGEQLAARHFSPADLSSFGRDVHGGVAETSALLAVRPDLVRPGFAQLPDYRAATLRESRELAMKPGWPGYFSSPSKASAAYGRDIEAWWVEGMTDLILRAVGGENLFNRPRWPEPAQGDPAYARLVEDILGPEREFALALERWLGRGGNR
jgi:creatinine amidohydrolase